MSNDINRAFHDDYFLGKDNASRRNSSAISTQPFILDALVTHRRGYTNAEPTVSGCCMGLPGPNLPETLWYDVKRCLKA